MEKTDSGCILLKVKEYDELIAKITVLENIKKPDTINLKWVHEYYISRLHGRGRGYDILRTNGEFILSDKLYNQVTNILRCLRSEFDSKLNDICYAQKMEDNKQFSQLSWWKRLTFKCNEGRDNQF